MSWSTVLTICGRHNRISPSSSRSVSNCPHPDWSGEYSIGCSGGGGGGAVAGVFRPSPDSESPPAVAVRTHLVYFEHFVYVRAVHLLVVFRLDRDGRVVRQWPLLSSRRLRLRLRLLRSHTLKSSFLTYTDVCATWVYQPVRAYYNQRLYLASRLVVQLIIMPQRKCTFCTQWFVDIFYFDV